MSRFKSHLVSDSKETDATVDNLKASIKNMEKLLKNSKGDRKMERKISNIINKQKELIKEIEGKYE